MELLWGVPPDYAWTTHLTGRRELRRLVNRGEHAPDAPYAYVADPEGYVIELEMPLRACARSTGAHASPRSGRALRGRKA